MIAKLFDILSYMVEKGWKKVLKNFDPANLIGIDNILIKSTQKLDMK